MRFVDPVSEEIFNNNDKQQKHTMSIILQCINWISCLHTRQESADNAQQHIVLAPKIVKTPNHPERNTTKSQQFTTIPLLTQTPPPPPSLSNRKDGDEVKMMPILPKQQQQQPQQKQSQQQPTEQQSDNKLSELWSADKADIANLVPPAFLRDWSVGEVLGEGSFGFVCRARSIGGDSSMDGAAKFILRQKVPVDDDVAVATTTSTTTTETGTERKLPREVEMMKALQGHPNIIKFIDFYDDGKSKFLVLISELFGVSWTKENPEISANTLLRSGGPGGLRPSDLFECIESHTEIPLNTIRGIIAQLVDVVCWMYTERSILHRDLKDENIVIDSSYNIKLIDFGSAFPVPYLDDDDGVGGCDFDDCCFEKCDGSCGAGDSGSYSGGNDYHDDRDDHSNGNATNNTSSRTRKNKRKEGFLSKFNGTIAFASPEILMSLRYRGSEAEVWSIGILLYTMVFKRGPFPTPDSILRGKLYLPSEDVGGLYDLIRKMLQKNPLRRIGLLELKEHPFFTL